MLDRLAFTGHSNEAQLAENILGLMRAGSGARGVKGLLRLLDEKGMGKDLGEMFPGSGGWYGDYPGSGYFRPS